MSTPSFDVSPVDFKLIQQIAARAMEIAKANDLNCKRMDLEMDLTACHANGCPLRLTDLLAADDANFGHDVFGIARYLNRSTGILASGFCPRYARPGGAA
jgi:hypothetical protein